MRAVCYCRVSTDEESQINALEHQIQEAKNCVFSNGWELVDSYIDEGKSGTGVKKRNEYKRLFEELCSNKFDIVVIKSQDRLMRNTKEWYLFIDALVSNKKSLYFYLESKFYTPDDALITGIKAILAEEFSRDLSKKIKNAHKNRQEKGESILLTSATWGYDKVDKKVVVNEKEAEVVRLIYDLCIQGYGSRTISKMLSERGVFSRTGGHFPEITIRRIIRNPLFKGTVIMNKRTTDFHTKKTIINTEDEWKIHNNAVPPIVTPEVWELANKIMDGRSQEVKTDNFKTKMIGKNKGNYELSSKIFCGCCGSVYWRKYRKSYKNKDEIIVDWTCSVYIKRGRNKGEAADGGCDNVHIKEMDLLNILSEVANSILRDKKESIIKHAMNIIEDILGDNNIETEKETLEKTEKKILQQKNLLLDKLLEGTITDRDYKRRDAELESKLAEIADSQKSIKQKETASNDMAERLNDIKTVLNETNMGEAQVSKLIKHIDKIVVFEDKMEIYFDFYEKIVADIPKEKRNDYHYADTNKQAGAVLHPPCAS